MAVNDFSKRYSNFHSELNSLFNDDLILTKRDCIGLEKLKEVFDIFLDRAANEVRFIRIQLLEQNTKLKNLQSAWVKNISSNWSLTNLHSEEPGYFSSFPSRAA